MALRDLKVAPGLFTLQTGLCAVTTGIYRIRHLASGRCYVGSSVNIVNRIARHKADLRHNKHDNVFLQRAWILYGEAAFEFEVIEVVVTEKLLEREQYWIDVLVKPGGGYNLAPVAGSTRGRKLSDAHKAALSRALKGRKRGPATEAERARLRSMRANQVMPPVTAEQRAQRALRMLGKKASPEARLAMSEAGKRRAPPTVAARLAMSAAAKGHVKSAQHLANLSASLKGRKAPTMTEEYRANLCAGQQRRRLREQAVSA